MMGVTREARHRQGPSEHKWNGVVILSVVPPQYHRLVGFPRYRIRDKEAYWFREFRVIVFVEVLNEALSREAQSVI